MEDVPEWNREAWNRQVAKGNVWTVPVDAATVERARNGDWGIVLTPTIPVPRSWFPEQMRGCRILALASGGGQQGPILAAAGAEVTVFDLSEAQLARDREVADREGLQIRLEQGEMRNLTRFASESFDWIVHPCSNTFVPDVRPVWSECERVLKPGGNLLAGFVNPHFWIFDDQKAEQDRELVVRHCIPYSDLESLDAGERQQLRDAGEPMCFGHRLEDLIGGQVEQGFSIVGFYEDQMGKHPLDDFIQSTIATRAIK